MKSGKSHRRLIFLHMPKAGGSALKRLIQRNYGVWETHALTGPTVREGIEAFKRLPTERRERIALLRGHQPFGLHKYLPEPATYMTFLREPIARVASFYSFARKLPGHHMHEVANRPGMTLRRFVEADVTPEITNLQVVTLAGDGLASFECDASTLERAKGNLERHFSMVGILEEFERSLALASVIFGWPPTPMRRVNVSQGNSSRLELDPETEAAIRDRNRYSIELYEHAKLMFENQVTERREEVDRTLAEMRRKEQSRLFRARLRARDEWTERVVMIRSRIAVAWKKRSAPQAR